MTQKFGRIAFDSSETDWKMVWTFPDDSTVEFDPTRIFGVTDDNLPGLSILVQAMCHGFKQKIADAAALPMVTEKGGRVRPPSMDEKAEAMREVIARLYSGVWNAERDGVPTGGLLFRAMQRLYPDKWETAAEFREFVEAQAAKRNVKPAVVEASLRKSRPVSDMIDTIRLEDGKSTGLDADEILTELEV